MVDINVIDPIAFTLESAAQRFARHAIELENESRWDGGVFPDDRPPPVLNMIQQYTIGAITVAVAGIEGLINELVTGADRRPASMQVPNLTPAAQRRWSKLWARDIPGPGYNALEKIQVALTTADLPSFPEDRNPAQDLRVLIRLRNELVHSVPKARRHGGPVAARDSLEKRLLGKFRPSTVVPESFPFIWYRCLSADCARWAVYTAADVRNELLKTLGVPITLEFDLPEISADERSQP